MRVLVTGGAGFVGSNVVTIAPERGHDVTATAREEPPCPAEGCRYAVVDLLDREAVAATIEEARPDAIVHTAIWNDLVGIYADRQRAWGSYVGVTEALADGANAVGAALLTVSTDWRRSSGSTRSSFNPAPRTRSRCLPRRFRTTHRSTRAPRPARSRRSRRR